MRTRRLITSAALVASAALVLSACGSDGDTNSASSPSATADKGAVTVVQAGYTENDILAQAYAAILEGSFALLQRASGAERHTRGAGRRGRRTPVGLEKSTDLVVDSVSAGATTYPP